MQCQYQDVDEWMGTLRLVNSIYMKRILCELLNNFVIIFVAITSSAYEISKTSSL
jgi:hypothetical protein